jgi:hypothetical protein
MKIMAPHANTAVLPIKNILFVLHPWTIEARNDASWMAVRDYVVHYRANPRPMEYMLDLASDFVSRYARGANIALLTHENLLAEIPEKHRSWPSRIFSDFDVSNLSRKNYDTVVLLYHDPIGLGWEDLEKTLKKIHVSQYVVINGRRREFIWDQSARRAIAFRRFLAKAWWLELLLVPLVWVIATFFYLSDALTGKLGNEA